MWRRMARASKIARVASGGIRSGWSATVTNVVSATASAASLRSSCGVRRCWRGSWPPTAATVAGALMALGERVAMPSPPLPPSFTPYSLLLSALPPPWWWLPPLTTFTIP